MGARIENAAELSPAFLPRYVANFEDEILLRGKGCEDPGMQMLLIKLEGDVRLNVTLILTTNTRSYV